MRASTRWGLGWKVGGGMSHPRICSCWERGGVKEIKEGIASRSTQTQGAFVCVCRLNDWVRRKERMTQEGHGKPLAAQGLLSFSRRRLF